MVTHNSLYAEQTCVRMGQAVAEIEGLLARGEGTLGDVVGLVRRQEAASRAAGFESVARVCHVMSESLPSSGDRRAENAWRITALALLDTCRDILHHAEDLIETGVGCRSDVVPAKRVGRSGEQPWIFRGWFAMSSRTRAVLSLSLCFLAAATLATPHSMPVTFGVLCALLAVTSDGLPSRRLSRVAAD